MELWYAFNPNRLEATHSRIIEDLLGLAEQGYQEAVDAVVEMTEDLIQHGRGSRYLFKLKDLPIWELKTAARGGIKGGTRVYLFITNDDRAVLVNGEVKAGSKASTIKLKEVLLVIAAFQQGAEVVRRKA